MTHPGSAPPRPYRAVVIGLGSIDRGDDAVGPIVASHVRDALEACGDAWVDVIAHEDPTALVDTMTGVDIAVVVDAAQSGDEPGRVTRHEVGRGASALPARTSPGVAGTHGLGLAAAIELARALDLLPARVVVVAVEAADFGPGEALSAPVAGAVPSAVDAILGILGIGVVGGRTGTPQAHSTR